MEKIITNNFPCCKYNQESSGALGWKHIKTYKPKLILLDIDIPDMNGFDILSNIRSQEVMNECIVIMITSDTSDDSNKKAIEMGANDYIPKPIVLPEFIKKINKYI